MRVEPAFWSEALLTLKQGLGGEQLAHHDEDPTEAVTSCPDYLVTGNSVLHGWLLERLHPGWPYGPANFLRNVWMIR